MRRGTHGGLRFIRIAPIPALALLVALLLLLYRSLEEAAEIVRGPVPPDLRERGFENARKLDFALQRHRLTDLWAPAL